MLLIFLVVASLAPTIHVRPYRTITAHSDAGRGVAFSPDSQLLATSSVDKTVKLWHLPETKLVRTIKQPEGLTSVAFSPDGQWLVTGSYDAMVRIWRVRDGALMRTLNGHSGTVWAVAFSPDSQQVVSGGEDKTVRVWRIGGTAGARVLTGHTLNVWDVHFSPDGQRIASSSFDKTVKIWRVDSGSLERTLTGHKEAIVGCAFSPNGELLASSSDDSTVRIWRVRDGALLRTIDTETHAYDVAFSPDGQFLATGQRERGAIGTLWKQIAGTKPEGEHGTTIKIWRVSDGALLQGLALHFDEVFRVAFSPDGKWLASSSDDKTIRLWQVSGSRLAR